MSPSKQRSDSFYPYVSSSTKGGCTREVLSLHPSHHLKGLLLTRPSVQTVQMALFDFPLEQLQKYLPPRDEPQDFDAFWTETLQEAREFPIGVQLERVDYGLKTVDIFDASFAGYAGQRIRGWYIRPRDIQEKLPCVVEYLGYGGGRGLGLERLLYASAGYAYLLMDTRGQGGAWQFGDTPDMVPLELAETGGGQHPGFMTRGILNSRAYYYRRVFTDAVRAVDAARALEGVDSSRIAVTGTSQGGGISLAVAGLDSGVGACLPDVPFLCHFKRATELIDTHPYIEISNYLRIHRDKLERVFQTLSYFDGLNFAARAHCPTLFSVGLMDDVCPPSTVYAAFNHYAGSKEMRVYPYNGHEGGGEVQALERLKFLGQLWE